MKIAVNTRLLIDGKLSGIGWFAYHTLKRIVKNNPRHQFIFLFDRKYDEQFIFGPNVIPEVVFPPTRHPILQHIWFNYSIIPVLKKHKPDLFYSPEGYSSLRLGKIPSLVVLHDINFVHYPKDVPFADSIYMRYFLKKYSQKADRSITVSEFSKSDICKEFTIPPDKINVACNAASEVFSEVSLSERNNIKNELTDGCDYFIYIGALLPRKNLARLLQAFDKFKEEIVSDVKLLIIGEKMFKTADIENAFRLMKFKNDVIFAGRLYPGQIEKAMGAALALTYVSYFEGFGLPIVEAMNCNVPVITSNVTSMPEVAGDAALLIDPFSVESIKNALSEIYLNQRLREELITKGSERKKLFNWDISANKFWKIIEKHL